ncbi:hypothetical protein ACOME3_009443 [Neoechinorhynchus agilis]
MVKRTYILFEHATGYALYRVKEFEEIGAFAAAEVGCSQDNHKLFASNVKLVAFSPFANAANALENLNAVSNGVIHNDLKVFLDVHLPGAGKREKIQLGVAGVNLSAALNEQLNVKVKAGDVIPEILRGIRSTFTKTLNDLSQINERQAQLGLGHAFSRSKVKYNVNRADNMITHSISLLDQLDKDINIFAMRIREWYGYHFPELYAIVPDNQLYAKTVVLIKDRNQFRKDATADQESLVNLLTEITNDPDKSLAILNATRTSIGMDMNATDFESILMFANRVISLSQYRSKLYDYLSKKMGMVAPNLTAIVGEQIGARLISHAGSLSSLAKYPASTIQILGAEKALFRALKTKTATPKYGILFHSSLIGKADRATKGRASRNVANKCAIASRIDCFAEIPTDVYGTKLRQLIEHRLQYYKDCVKNENAKKPPLTSEVMMEALEEVEAVRLLALKAEKRKKSKKHADASTLDSKEVEIDRIAESVTKVTISPPKKNKRQIKEEHISMDVDE